MLFHHHIFQLIVTIEINRELEQCGSIHYWNQNIIQLVFKFNYLFPFNIQRKYLDYQRIESALLVDNIIFNLLLPFSKQITEEEHSEILNNLFLLLTIFNESAQFLEMARLLLHDVGDELHTYVIIAPRFLRNQNLLHDLVPFLLLS